MRTPARFDPKTRATNRETKDAKKKKKKKKKKKDVDNMNINEAIMTIENYQAPAKAAGKTVTITVSTWGDTSEIEALTGLAAHANSHNGAIGVARKGDGVVKANQDGLTGAFYKPLPDLPTARKAAETDRLTARAVDLLLDILEDGYIRRAVISPDTAEPKGDSCNLAWEQVHGKRTTVSETAQAEHAKAVRTVKGEIDRISGMVTTAVLAGDYTRAKDLAETVELYKSYL